MFALFSLALGTFVSEDLTCITAGLLIQRGAVDPIPGVLACALGILVGDVGLWGVGRLFGRAALGWPWIARQMKSGGVDQLRASLERHAAAAILGSRFLPGARLPLYVLAGVVSLPARVFALWAAVAALAWTPVLVLLTAKVGDAFVARLSGTARLSLAPAVLVTVGAMASIRLARSLRHRRTIG